MSAEGKYKRIPGNPYAAVCYYLVPVYFIIFFLQVGTVQAQVVRTGVISTILDSLAAAIPADTGNNLYTTPTSDDEVNWKLTIKQILQSNYNAAHTNAGLYNYSVIQFTDTSSQKVYYILAKTDNGTNYWGYYVFAAAPARQKLVIQAPHSRYDFKTELQSNYVFVQTGARTLCVAGTHRCNSTGYSTCAGTTTVCQTGGASESFRTSDQAHNVNSAFQYTTFILDSLISNVIVVQLHGFSKTESDPALIMSNGVTQVPSTDYLTTLKAELLAIDSTLTFKILHIDSAWNKLTGTTNVQGRLINSSINPCNNSASTNSGRFLHIEQAYTGLRDNITNWGKMSTALSETFPEDPLPVELVSFTARTSGTKVILQWRTETEVNNYGFEIERVERSPASDEPEISKLAGFVQGWGNSNSPKEYSYTDVHTLLGKVYLYRLKQIDFDGSFAYSTLVTIGISETGFRLSQNYPNPFNPSTVISFYLPQEEMVRLSIYNVIGSEVKTLLNEVKPKGLYTVTWNGNNQNGFAVTGGIYIYKLTAGEFSDSRKMIMIK